MKAAKQWRTQTTHPFSICLLPPKLLMHCYFSDYSFIKGNFKGSLIINNLEHWNITSQLLLTSFCIVMLYSSEGRAQALRYSVFQSTCWIITDTSAVAHWDTALNVPNKNNALHTYSCWQSLHTLCNQEAPPSSHKDIYTHTHTHTQGLSKMQTLSWWSQLHIGSGKRHFIS